MALLLLSSLSGCAKGSTPYIDFRQHEERVAEESKRVQSPKPLRIALASVISPKDTVVYYRQLADYIGEKMHRPVALLQRSTYEEVNMLLANGDADIAFASTGSYCSYRGMSEIEILAMVEHRGTSAYRALVVVPADSGARSIEDLQGQTFAFTDPLSNSGRMIILKYLQERQKTPETFFQRYVYTYSHDKSLRAVANRLVDGASVDSMIYDLMQEKNPAEAAKVKVIASFGPFPTGPVVVRKELGSALKEQLREVFLSCHTREGLKHALKGLLIDRFVLPQPELYEPLRQFYGQAG
ncbi:MAG: substrate-binding domain-containing protein [Desulfurispora sp.]|uniref:substrate-binding domain-containing protein n=1 Tax=Desulfurispora sp. TaxID=3014275 RepID=UPI004049D46D